MQPSPSYIICFTPRCGSTLLCESLTNTGVAGKPEEYFGIEDEHVWKKCWGVSTFAEYLASAVKQGSTPNGVCGVKMMWTQFDDLANKMRLLSAYKGLSVPDCMKAVFPNLHYIWIKRHDKVRQAISLAKARQTNVWALTTDLPPRSIRKPVFSFEQIDFIVYELELYEAAWERYFMKHSIQPLIVIYEDLVSNYEKIALQILKELDIPTEQVAFGPRRLKQQADEESEQWAQRYYYLKTRSKWYSLVSRVNKLLMTFLGSTVIRVYVKMYEKRVRQQIAQNERAIG